MKKNLKLVSAAAAALITVAPVVATTVAPAFADTPATTNDQVNATASYSKLTYVNKGTTVSAIMQQGFNISFTNGITQAWDGSSKLTVEDANGNVIKDNNTALEAGKTYTEVYQTALRGQADKTYTITLPDGSKINAKANDLGQLMDVNNNDSTIFKFTKTIKVYNSQTPGTPFLAFNGQSLRNGQTVNTTLTIKNSNVADVVTALKNSGIRFYENGDTTYGTPVTVTPADVKASLKAQGITVNADDSFSAPNGLFNVTVSQMNTNNGQTANVVVPFKVSSADNSAKSPVILVNGQAAPANKTYTVKYGSDFNPYNFKDSDGNTVRITANYNRTNTIGLSMSSMDVANNPVNTKVPGYYTVTVEATNNDNYTTKWSYTVLVLPKEQEMSKGVKATVNYSPYYAVATWNAQGNTYAYAGDAEKKQGGSTVTVYGTVTIDGVEFARLDSPTSNHLIMTKYLIMDGQSNNTNADKPAENTNSDKGTEMSAIGYVPYVSGHKGWKIALVDQNGKYTGKYISANSSWKVWEKKTVNGRTMYRIGTQSQWIPAEFINVD